MRVSLATLLLHTITFIVGVITNIVSGLLFPGWWSVVILVGLAIALFIVYRLLLLREGMGWRIRPDAPKSLGTPAEKEANAYSGLVAFVSLYNPMPNSGGFRLTPEERLQAAERLDYAALDFENSNLELPIFAVTTHRSRLRHCWLIGTVSSSADAPGSAAYIPALIRYLREEKQIGADCEFHYGPRYEVSIDNDALVYTKCNDLVHAIYREAVKPPIGLREEEVVVDVTSGIRGLSLGGTLATIDPKRPIQMISAKYGPDGRIVPHKLLPILINFELVSPQTDR